MERPNFFYLLIALLIFLVAIPLSDDFIAGNPPLIKAILFSLILVIGVGSLRGGGRFQKAGIGFVVVGLILTIATARTQSTALQLGSLFSLIGFLLVAIIYTMKQVVVGKEVSTNRLVGAVCVYLLLGTIWALMYSILELTVPGSFTGFDAWNTHSWNSEWLYFSFVTMTTLGYGDVLPISATARAMAYMQAAFGQFYIAVLVAGLVGAFIAQKDKS